MPLLVGWRYAGYNMAIFLSGLLAIPKETIEASIVDGASYIQRLSKVYFPQMWPSFILATTMCLIGSFAVFDELVAMGALYVNPEAKLLSILFFTYGFQVGASGDGYDPGCRDFCTPGFTGHRIAAVAAATAILAEED